MGRIKLNESINNNLILHTNMAKYFGINLNAYQKEKTRTRNKLQENIFWADALNCHSKLRIIS